MKWFSGFGVIILATCLLFFGVSKFVPKETYKESSLKTNIIVVDNGYGYQILNGDKILIEQKSIPAVEGKCSFKTQKDAKLVGDLVVYKLINGQSPVVTYRELKDLNIVVLKSNNLADGPS